MGFSDALARRALSCDVTYLIAESLAEQGGDPDLAVEAGRDAGPAVVGGRPVGARGVPLVALHEMKVHCHRFLLGLCTGSAKRLWPGLVNYVAAVAYHSCLALPAAFTQPRGHLLAEPCSNHN